MLKGKGHILGVSTKAYAVGRDDLEAIERAVHIISEARPTGRMCFALTGGDGGGGFGGCDSPPFGDIGADNGSVAASASRFNDSVTRYGGVQGGSGGWCYDATQGVGDPRLPSGRRGNPSKMTGRARASIVSMGRPHTHPISMPVTRRVRRSSGAVNLHVWVRPCGDCRSSALPEARRTTFPKAH